jgi:hypothetical protein
MIFTIAYMQTEHRRRLEWSRQHWFAAGQKDVISLLRKLIEPVERHISSLSDDGTPAGLASAASFRKVIRTIYAIIPELSDEE